MVINSKLITRDEDGNLCVEASDLGIRPNDTWPFTLGADGLTWTFNRPLFNGSGMDQEWVGNIYIALTPAGKRELTIFND